MQQKQHKTKQHALILLDSHWHHTHHKNTALMVTCTCITRYQWSASFLQSFCETNHILPVLPVQLVQLVYAFPPINSSEVVFRTSVHSKNIKWCKIAQKVKLSRLTHFLCKICDFLNHRILVWQCCILIIDNHFLLIID